MEIGKSDGLRGKYDSVPGSHSNPASFLNCQSPKRTDAVAVGAGSAGDETIITYQFNPQFTQQQLRLPLCIPIPFTRNIYPSINFPSCNKRRKLRWNNVNLKQSTFREMLWMIQRLTMIRRLDNRPIWQMR